MLCTHTHDTKKGGISKNVPSVWGRISAKLGPQTPLQRVELPGTDYKGRVVPISVGVRPRPHRHPNPLISEAGEEPVWGPISKTSKQTHVPNCLGARPEQFGTCFLTLTLQCGSRTGPKRACPNRLGILSGRCDSAWNFRNAEYHKQSVPNAHTCPRMGLIIGFQG